LTPQILMLHKSQSHKVNTVWRKGIGPLTSAPMERVSTPIKRVFRLCIPAIVKCRDSSQMTVFCTAYRKLLFKDQPHALKNNITGIDLLTKVQTKSIPTIVQLQKEQYIEAKKSPVHYASTGTTSYLCFQRLFHL